MQGRPAKVIASAMKKNGTVRGVIGEAHAKFHTAMIVEMLNDALSGLGGDEEASKEPKSTDGEAKESSDGE